MKCLRIEKHGVTINLTSLFTDASALRRVGTTSSSMYCLADMAATSASVWVGVVEDVVAAGTVMRGFLTAGGSAVSEMEWIVNVGLLRLLASQRSASVPAYLLSGQASCRWP